MEYALLGDENCAAASANGDSTLRVPDWLTRVSLVEMGLMKGSPRVLERSTIAIKALDVSSDYDGVSLAQRCP